MKELNARDDMRTEYPSENRIVKRLRSLQKKLQRQELARKLGSQYGEVSTAESEIKAIKWALLKRKILSFFKDFDHYIDFSIAKFLVWRELRHRRKEAKSTYREN